MQWPLVWRKTYDNLRLRLIDKHEQWETANRNLGDAQVEIRKLRMTLATVAAERDCLQLAKDDLLRAAGKVS